MLNAQPLNAGETKRKLSKGLDVHKKAVRMADLNASTIVEHSWSEGQSVDLNGVTVLDQDKNLYPRLKLESYHITKQPLPLIRDKGSLPSAYDYRLRDFVFLNLVHFFHLQLLIFFAPLLFSNFPTSVSLCYST